MSGKHIVGGQPKKASVLLNLTGVDFEQRTVPHSSLWQIPEGTLRTCLAENLLVHKCFAGWEQDWVDMDGIRARQKGNLDLALVRRELKPLPTLRNHQADKLERLEQKIREHDRPFTILPPPD